MSRRKNTRFLSVKLAEPFKAIAKAGRSPDAHLRDIYKFTRGIAFLGTPHHGSNLASFAEQLARSVGLIKYTNPQILATLKHDSEVLARVLDDFHNIIRDRDQLAVLPPVDMTCFYEELAVPAIGKVS